MEMITSNRWQFICPYGTLRLSEKIQTSCSENSGEIQYSTTTRILNKVPVETRKNEEWKPQNGTGNHESPIGFGKTKECFCRTEDIIFNLLQAALTSTPGSALRSGIPTLEHLRKKKKPGSTLPNNFVFSSKGTLTYETLDLLNFVNGFSRTSKTATRWMQARPHPAPPVVNGTRIYLPMV